MRYRLLAEDFDVEELLHLPPRQAGPFTLYRVRKVARTTLEVQAALAHALACPPAAVHFPALKDRHAVAVQYAAVRAEGPAELHGDGWRAQRLGRAGRPLRAGDLQGNRFTVVLRDLGADEVAPLAGALERLARSGLPNYLDEQRFGSYSPGHEWVGKTILRGDAEGALRAHLGQNMAGDPPEVLAFKAQVRAHWGDWARLFEAAPRPSNWRSVVVFLRDHPADYRRALNLVTPRVLSLYLSAYQGLLWNRLTGRYLRGALPPGPEIEIAGERLPLYRDLPPDLVEQWREEAVPLPHHRAAYGCEWAGLFAALLGEEGLQQGEFKARLLRRAYLGPSQRRLLLFPGEPAVLGEEADERFRGRRKVTARFTLPPGAYATLVLRALAAETLVADSGPGFE